MLYSNTHSHIYKLVSSGSGYLPEIAENGKSLYPLINWINSINLRNGIKLNYFFPLKLMIFIYLIV